MLNTKEIIQKSLKNPVYLSYWLEAIIDEKITIVKYSIQEPILGEKTLLLVQKIKSLINKRKNKPHFVQAFFSRLFAIKIQNTSKQKLHILIDQFHTELYKIKIKYKSTQKEHQEVLLLLKDLRLLCKEFITYNNTYFFIKEIEGKIALIESYNITLLFKQKSLLEILTLYENIKAKG